ncbi:hypothetical protein BU17DRAFT_72364 [Hysterangium stoloniferum]|nr:hypothetical protein BU17DRAFT_72364 [Hysterangium stoloniferum]
MYVEAIQQGGLVVTGYVVAARTTPGTTMGFIALGFGGRVQDPVVEAYDPIQWKWRGREILVVIIHGRLCGFLRDSWLNERASGAVTATGLLVILLFGHHGAVFGKT